MVAFSSGAWRQHGFDPFYRPIVDTKLSTIILYLTYKEIIPNKFIIVNIIWNLFPFVD